MRPSKAFLDHLAEIVRWSYILQSGEYRRGNGELITDPEKLAFLAMPASAKFLKTWNMRLNVGDVFALQEDFESHSLILWRAYKERTKIKF